MYKILALLMIFFTGCYKNHLYVQQEWVDREFLASSHVDTPDPRQENPPEGQRILVSWKFPPMMLDQQLKMVLTVRFWDNSEELLCYPIGKCWGYTAFFFPNCRILTYRIQVVDNCDDVVETWEHQFWTELIDVDRSKDSVSSQSRQGSVIDTP